MFTTYIMPKTKSSVPKSRYTKKRVTKRMRGGETELVDIGVINDPKPTKKSGSTNMVSTGIGFGVLLAVAIGGIALVKSK